MANNPNPSLITPALWHFAQSCLAMQPGTEFGGIVATNQGGYHNTRNNLINQGRTNDYSIRYGPDKLGPGDKCAAFDWTFPDAQRGDYGTIIRYGERVRAAYQSRDPRPYGFREVLIQADWDNDAEGYDFYLGTTRTPDSSHLWHGHFSVLRQFLNDMNAMNGMLSILAGESLSTWQAGRSRYGGTGVEDDVTPDENRRLFNVDEGYLASVVDMEDDAIIVPWSKTPESGERATVPNKLSRAIKSIQSDMSVVKAALDAPAEVELPADFADQVAQRVVAQMGDALSSAIADKLAARLKD